jgi:UDP-N-acetylglucosamine 2-epimerase (non-hydrolysing)
MTINSAHLRRRKPRSGADPNSPRPQLGRATRAIEHAESSLARRPATKILVVFGTRPEAIKMAPVILELRRRDVELRVCSTGQHATMVENVLPIFGIEPDYALGVMRPGQSLSAVTSNVFVAMESVLTEFRPDWVLVQGDTTSAMVGAVSAFYHRTKLGHVEAGLRTGDMLNPWPEEFNRRVAALVATRHFAPTLRAEARLLAEGVPAESIRVTGNTVIDALLFAVRRIEEEPKLRRQFAAELAGIPSNKRLILVTGHRRESFGEGFRSICRALARLAQRPDLVICYPVHLNPSVQQPVHELLGARPSIHLCAPLDYLSFVYLMHRSYLVLTDSGGIQEEAPTLGKPVLVMRTTSERPEAIEAGTSRLVGTDPDRIFSETCRLLDDPSHYDAMSRAANPFGDGTASRQIVSDLMNENAI